MKNLRMALAMVALLAACGAGQPVKSVSTGTLQPCEPVSDAPYGVCRVVDKDYGVICYELAAGRAFSDAVSISCVAVAKASLP